MQSVAVIVFRKYSWSRSLASVFFQVPKFGIVCERKFCSVASVAWSFVRLSGTFFFGEPGPTSSEKRGIRHEVLHSLAGWYYAFVSDLCVYRRLSWDRDNLTQMTTVLFFQHYFIVMVDVGCTINSILESKSHCPFAVRPVELIPLSVLCTGVALLYVIIQ